MHYSGCGRDVDSKFLDPHISSSHPSWEDDSLWRSPNDKRRPSMSLHVAGLTSSRGPHVCPGSWFGDSPTEGTNILLLVTMPLCTNQLHAMWIIIFSWIPYPQSCDTHQDSIEFPGIKIFNSRKTSIPNAFQNLYKKLQFIKQFFFTFLQKTM